MDNNITTKAKKIKEMNNGNICDCCLGRKFSNISKLEKCEENKKREKLIRKTLQDNYNNKNTQETFQNIKKR
ncbi:hypothetical protein ALNOE001_05900 [Candidatus Methanobinarius endosymbioticus]|uniref:tRNA pseudouridine synthase Pus10 n=1 Tax=Candidatus Methanobinarius endosymbioticus TaxID=2006182 RepID=A0A366MEZ8_9EURY|nr:hypothetical protein ALNOE001_05900 [Candidatus Methanobinarius endosymbioticus]